MFLKEWLKKSGNYSDLSQTSTALDFYIDIQCTLSINCLSFSFWTWVWASFFLHVCHIDSNIVHS